MSRDAQSFGGVWRWGPALVAGLLLCLAFDGQALAQRRGGPGGMGPRVMGPGPGRHLDNRFAHNQYYFNRGWAVQRPPPGGRMLWGRDGSRWWYGGGDWYRWGGGSWMVAPAPFGMTVPVLPPFYSTVWSSGLPYYYANDTFYTWDDAQRGYQVVPPPQGIETRGTTEPPGSNQLFVYPRSGQTPEQQSTDRFQCHQWAVEQSGFDPTVAGGGVPQGQLSQQRDHYFRAETACLQGRGYSVE